jgi:hypothetical protein
MINRSVIIIVLIFYSSFDLACLNSISHTFNHFIHI